MNKIFIILFLLIYNLFLFTTPSFSEDNKIKIGLLVPLTGENAEIGKQIVQATRLALNDINSNKIERSLPEIEFSSETAIFNSDVTSAFLLSIPKS